MNNAPTATPYGTLPPASPVSSRKPVSLPRLNEMRARGEKIVMLTAYDATFAAVADAAGVECILVTLTGPGAPMTVGLFRGNTNPATALTTTPRNYQVQQTTNGAFALFVGATLNVNANQAPGTYSGTWTLTLDYQ